MAKAAYVGVSPYTDITADNISSYFSVSDNSYYFARSGSSFTSNNNGVSSSSAVTTLTALQSFPLIEFDYSVSSESGYDKLTISVAGSTVVSAISGTQSGSWSGALSSGQTIVLTYSKDGSVDNGNDRGVMSNLKVYTAVDVAKKIKKGYIGVDGIARKIKKAYIGVAGVARLFWSGVKKLVPYGELFSPVPLGESGYNYDPYSDAPDLLGSYSGAYFKPEIRKARQLGDYLVMKRSGGTSAHPMSSYNRADCNSLIGVNLNTLILNANLTYSDRISICECNTSSTDSYMLYASNSRNQQYSNMSGDYYDAYGGSTEATYAVLDTNLLVTSITPLVYACNTSIAAFRDCFWITGGGKVTSWGSTGGTYPYAASIAINDAVHKIDKNLVLSSAGSSSRASPKLGDLDRLTATTANHWFTLPSTTYSENTSQVSKWTHNYDIEAFDSNGVSVSSNQFDTSTAFSTYGISVYGGLPGKIVIQRTGSNKTMVISDDLVLSSYSNNLLGDYSVGSADSRTIDLGYKDEIHVFNRYYSSSSSTLIITAYSLSDDLVQKQIDTADLNQHNIKFTTSNSSDSSSTYQYFQGMYYSEQGFIPAGDYLFGTDYRFYKGNAYYNDTKWMWYKWLPFVLKFVDE